MNSIDVLLDMEDRGDIDYFLIEIMRYNDDLEVRLAVSEMLAMFPCDKSEEILLSMLDDKDYIVRASSCDSLYFSKSEKVLQHLKKIAVNDYYIVRGYAFFSIGDIINNTEKFDQLDFLKKCFFKEKSKWVKVAIAEAFSLNCAEDSRYMDFILAQVYNKKYQIRSMALKSIKMLAEKEKIINTDVVDKKLRLILKTENVEFLRNDIMEALKMINAI